MSQRVVTSLNWTTDILKKISIKIMKKKKKRYISQRNKKKRGDHFLWWKKENEREYWEERKEESTLRKKRLGTRYVFFPFCLYIHSWHKIKSTHNYSYFINMHLHELIIPQCFCVVFLPCISTVHPTMNLHHLSIPFQWSSTKPPSMPC